jgi:type II secretory pathway component PulF
MSESSASLDDLILLNREIAALVKAGIPLELGLRGLSGSVGTRLGRLSERLSKRLASGRSLPEALAEEGPAISPVYTAVMEAGLASGRLPEALEAMAASGQLIQETRRRVFLAVLYPVICAVVGYLMFCGFLTFMAPHLVKAAEMFRFPSSWPIELARTLHQHRRYATMVIPSVVLSLIVLTVLLRNSVTRVPWRWLSSFCWVPGVRAIRRSQDWAQFAELLAMQLEHSTPLTRAFTLAADSIDDSRFHREARIMSEKLAQGHTLSQSLGAVKSLPSLVRWMLVTGEKQGTLALTLRQLADTFRRQAIRRANDLKTWLPVIITIGVTGTIGLAYGLVFFIPMRALLFGLMNE